MGAMSCARMPCRVRENHVMKAYAMSCEYMSSNANVMTCE